MSTEQLKSHLKGKIAILGIGNTLRSDDGVGSYIARHCEESPLRTSEVRSSALRKCGGGRRSNLKTIIIDAGTMPENYIAKVAEFKPDRVIFIDALAFGGQPGECRIVKAQDLSDTTTSTHNLSLKLLAQAIQEQHECDIILLGIQPETTQFGEKLSESVAKTADEILSILHNCINSSGV